MIGFGNNTRRALSSIREYKLRAGLAMAGIAMSTASMVLVGDILASFESRALSSLNALGGRVIVIASQIDSRDSTRIPRPLTAADAAFLNRRMRGMASVSPVMNALDTVHACGQSQTITLMGVPRTVSEVPGRLEGRFIRPIDVDTRSRVVVIGKALNERFGCAGLIGTSLRIGTDFYTVVGRLNTENRNTVASVAFVPMTTLAHQYGEQFGRSVAIRVEASEQRYVSTVMNIARRELRRLHRLAPTAPDDFTMRTDQAVVAEVGRTVDVITAGLVALLSIGVLVAAVGVMNALLTAVVERTSEIGLRRCVGATKQHIRDQFLIESVIVSGSGAALGIATGLSVSWAFVTLVGLSASHNIDVIIFAMSLSLILGTAVGVWPAARAAALAPIDALRHE